LFILSELFSIKFDRINLDFDLGDLEIELVELVESVESGKDLANGFS